MSVLKTLISAAVAGMIMAPGVRADADLAKIVAGCVGRFSAELEHAWLLNDPRSIALERQRAGFLSILDAVMPADAGHHILNLRIDAKQAQARLLTSATFGTHPARSAWAKRQASIYAETCAEMLLDS